MRAPDSADRYEVAARLFYASTGMMAPGKDEPMAMNSTHTHEERREAYENWITSHAWRDALNRIVMLEAKLEDCREGD
jgi:hypothetical protein